MRAMKADTPDSVMSRAIPSQTMKQAELSVQTLTHGDGSSRFSAKSPLCKRLKEIEKYRPSMKSRNQLRLNNMRQFHKLKFTD